MKRLPLISTVLALAALSASCAYWVLQLYQPPQRPIAAPPPAAVVEPPIEAATTLFGGQPVAAAVSNFQLTGVVAAGGPDSVAIIVADGKTPQAVKVGKEVAPGVLVKEVKARYVMLSDGGVMKRLDLPEAKPAAPAPDLTAPLSPGAIAPQPAPAPTPQPVAPPSNPPPPSLQMPAPMRGTGGPVEPPQQK